MTLEEIIAYLNEYDPDLVRVEDESQAICFQKVETYHHYHTLTDLSIDPHLHSASVRVFVGSFFKDCGDEESFQLINYLNANCRFASFYLTQNTLIIEQDILLVKDDPVPPLIDYIILLTAHAKDLIDKQ